jgi:hypothetical protein
LHRWTEAPHWSEHEHRTAQDAMGAIEFLAAELGKNLETIAAALSSREW